jgi:adenine-specific DNA-methyltransferase
VGRQVNGRWKVFRKAYSHSKEGDVARRKLKTIPIDNSLYTERGQAAFDEIMPTRLFQSPKPVGLLTLLARTATSGNDTILDFFVGSGTTGHAVLDLNTQDGSNRKFIAVQLPEPTGRQDFPTIAAIAKERIRRVIKKLNEEAAGRLDLKEGAKPDRGFKVFRLERSNFTAWDPEVPKEPDALAKQLEMHVQHIAPGRTEEDILFEILLKSGYALSASIQKLNLAGRTVYSIDGGLLVICLDHALNREVIQGIAGLKPAPERVVLLDEGFAGNDQLKTNAVQTMKAKGIVFHTV